MKKLVIMLALLLPVAASAQFHVGGQFNINFDNEATNYSSGAAEFKEKEFVVSLRPKIYWYLNDKMQLGGRVGIGFGRLTSGTLYDSESKEKDATNTVNRALGWSLCPFYGYKLVDASCSNSLLEIIDEADKFMYEKKRKNKELRN